MSIFLGPIEEIPGICVDRFDDQNHKYSAFFLSHCHTDHMQGLDLNFLNQLDLEEKYLYCSHASKILMQHKYNFRNNCIKSIDIDNSICIKYKLKNSENNEKIYEYVDVTAVSAEHCIGSVMFLFKKKDISVLYTGDFRHDPNNYSKLQYLHHQGHFRQLPLKFTSIYLDTTFFSPSYREFPSREESILKIRDMAEEFLRKNPKNIVVLNCPSPFGYECLYMELSILMKRKICVKDFAYCCYKHIPGFRNYVTDDKFTSRIYAYNVTEKREPNTVLKIKPSALIWKNRKTNVVQKRDSTGLNVNVCYSTHSSFTELQQFIKYFRAEKLIPCVCPMGQTLEETNSLLKEFLSDVDDSSTSDNLNYGLSLSKFQALKASAYVENDFDNSEDDWS